MERESVGGARYASGSSDTIRTPSLPRARLRWPGPSAARRQVTAAAQRAREGAKTIKDFFDCFDHPAPSLPPVPQSSGGSCHPSPGADVGEESRQWEASGNGGSCGQACRSKGSCRFGPDAESARWPWLGRACRLQSRRGVGHDYQYCKQYGHYDGGGRSR